MDPPLTAELFSLILDRDEAAGHGQAGMDTEAVMDRHLLIGEVYRLQGVISRLREGRPIK
jgi:hypothetical protein